LDLPRGFVLAAAHILTDGAALNRAFNAYSSPVSVMPPRLKMVERNRRERC